MASVNILCFRTSKVVTIQTLIDSDSDIPGPGIGFRLYQRYLKKEHWTFTCFKERNLLTRLRAIFLTKSKSAKNYNIEMAPQKLYIPLG